MFCRDRCVVKAEQGVVTVAPLRCRCWSCEECRPDRTRRLVHEARSGKPTLFITLTSRKRADRSPSWAAQELVKCWRLIRRRYIKEFRKAAKDDPEAGTAQAQADGSAPAATQDAPVAPSACSKCGAKLAPQAKFCAECGTSVQAAVS